MRSLFQHRQNKPELRFFWIIILFMVIAVSPRLDIWFSKLFYNNGQFFIQHGILAWLIDTGIPAILSTIGVVILGLWIAGKVLCRDFFGIDTKVMLLTFGSMLIGPGLITNGLFKSFWGRARPYDIAAFGGEKLFTPPMVISNECHLDCSFMSGHTAIGFWVLSLALLAPQRHRSAAVIAAVLFGTLLGLGRIAQGLHFFSDVFFAAVITCTVIYWLHAYLFSEQYR